MFSRVLQARRTKSSSPLGQLFDHGCDALTVHLLLANTQIAVASPCGWLSAIMQGLVRRTA
jgi:ethanolaminephosphotransferase